ncbi:MULTISPECIES: hypothetical protein [Xanthomonas]|uniref:Uncharacterized protein n=1 Tax=Xanthomonas dyei TaxID=743699 RepID=A0ABZ0D9T3_9XANT|nr:hypothetical protein [Xanthomonas dyei]WOB27045.1 hypothetical protein NYR99_03425 [Xanthomonas dyei]WOB54667.1 hypothetical protein NYR95_03430 [Xanthomonas dyei]
MKYKISDIYDCDLGGEISYDIAICSVTGETRGWVIPDLVSNMSKEVWVFAKKNNNLPYEQDKYGNLIRYPGFTVLRENVIEEAISNFMEGRNEAVRILIDVTCMTRTDMGALFGALLKRPSLKCVPICITVAYVLAEYSEPPLALTFNEDIKPVTPLFAGWPADAISPTSLIVGLGYERGKADGACEYFDSAENWIFVPRSPIENYDKAVRENNQQIIDKASRQGMLIFYDVNRPVETITSLGALVDDQCFHSNPLILPFGPKIFFAMSLIISAVRDQLGVWHATGDSDIPENDHRPSGVVVSFSIDLQPVDYV